MRVAVLAVLLAISMAGSSVGVEVVIEPYNDDYLCRSHFIGEVIITNESRDPYDISWFRLVIYVSHKDVKRVICIVRCGRAQHEHDELILQSNSAIRIPLYIAMVDGEFVFPDPGVYEIQAVLQQNTPQTGFIYSDPVSVKFVDGELPEYFSDMFRTLATDRGNLCRVFSHASSFRVLRNYNEVGEFCRVVEEYLLFQLGNAPLYSYVRHRLNKPASNRDYVREVLDWNRNRSRYEWSKGWLVELFWEALDDHVKGRASQVDEFVRVSPRWR